MEYPFAYYLDVIESSRGEFLLHMQDMVDIHSTRPGVISIAILQTGRDPTGCKTASSPPSISPADKYDQLDKLHTLLTERALITSKFLLEAL